MSNPSIGSPAADRCHRLVTHCVHAIATGRWPPGHRLPSVRDAEEQWGLHRLTVLKAYRELRERGLVATKGRAGFFVSGGPKVDRVRRHRVELDRLYRELHQRIREETELSVVGTVRYLQQLAEAVSQECPEVVFLECTRYQAELHAAEVFRRLGVACMALDTSSVEGYANRIPDHVRILLTTAYHRREAQALGEAGGFPVAEVRIVFDEKTLEDLPHSNRGVDVASPDNETAREIAEEIRRCSPKTKVSVRSVQPADLASLLSRQRDDRRALLLSPTLYEIAMTLDADWVRPVRYRIEEACWEEIAEALGMPLGIQV